MLILQKCRITDLIDFSVNDTDIVTDWWNSDHPDWLMRMHGSFMKQDQACWRTLIYISQVDIDSAAQMSSHPLL